MKRAVSVCLTLGLLAVTTDAFADGPSKKECIDANLEAQKNERDGKLLAAQASLELCSNAACPAAVRDDCTQLLDQLATKIPTVIFDAHEVNGAEISAIRVTLDGRVIPDAVVRRGIPLDPGAHQATIESANHVTRAIALTIREDDHPRRERVVLDLAEQPKVAAAKEPPPQVPVNESPPPVESTSHTPTLRYAGIVTGAVGIVGIGIGTIFGLKAKSNNDDSKVDPTNTGCDGSNACGSAGKSAREDAQSAATVSTVGFVAGGVLLAAGVAMFVFAPSSSSKTTARIAPYWGANGGGAMLTGSFQ